MRIRSIDIFRGATMLVMVFVNELAGVKGLPWWTYHMPPGKDGMTYVDVVFPAFLFIVGLSIPLAVEKRLEKHPSMARLWAHILTRSVSLVVLGLVLANAEKVSQKATGMPPGTWALLALAGAILYLLDYPGPSKPGDSPRRNTPRVLKYGGLALLIAMLTVFRRDTPAGAAWLDFGYWEILGLIGRAYLAACILYVPFRKSRWAPLAWFVALSALNVLTRVGMPSPGRVLPYWAWPFDSGDHPSIVMAGIVIAKLFVDEDRGARSFQTKAAWALGFAAALFAAGWAFLFLGLQKNSATPSWCLFSEAIGVVLFVFLYWIADVRGWRRWADFLKPAGSNTLLTYLLPDLYYFAILALGISIPWRSGIPGLAWSLAFTAGILGLSYLLTRARVRMQL